MPIRGASGWGALTSTLEIPGIMSDLSTKLEAHAQSLRNHLAQSQRGAVATPSGDVLAHKHCLDARSEQSQLSVTTYFSDELFRRELELIFQHGPRYLGHELSVPELGDYHALPQEGEGRALVRTAKGVELLSNVCRHRQALMLRGRGNTGHTAAGPQRRQHRLPAAPLDLQPAR